MPLPSAWLIERTIRELADAWPRNTMSILSERSSGAFSAGSVYSITVPPTCSRSPLASAAFSAIRLPLTKVPFELPRSITVQSVPS